ncbi:MAG: TonB-dependent receptor, partial [Acidobacteria bacterium]|nr:TonB-dependent receptor [Acidobacteriota bacterium]
ILTHVPLPNGESRFQNLTSVEPQDKAAHQFSVRVDHRLSDTDQLFVRFSSFDADEIQPFGTSVQQEALVPGFGRTLDTTARNLGVSHTRTFGTSMLNELRVGYMSVDGGQASLNAGVDFAGQVGLQGVSRNPRDVGFPQISTAGLYSTMGDPTTFVSRHNEQFEVYDNFLIDRGDHRLKFGGYLFHLKFRPRNADTARGAFTYTGQWTGNALADFLLGFPTSARSGVGGGDEDARTTWLHLYAQDDWRARDNLTFNYGLRYELNSHMKDVDNRLSSIDLSVPGGRYVIASDDAGNISPDAEALLPLIPIPWVTSSEIGWERSLLRPSKKRFAPRVGFALSFGEDRPAVIRGGYGIFLNQWAYSVQTAFTRNLPFFFLKQVDAPSDQLVPTLQTRDILTSDATGSIGGAIMDHDFQVEYTQTWSGGIQVEALPRTMVEVSYMGSYTIGADNSTIRNVPTPGPGRIDTRRPIPALSAIRAIRFDGTSIYHAVTVKAERRFDGRSSFNVAYTLSTSTDDASSPGATTFESNVPQDVRNIFPGEQALSSFDHRHRFVASGSYQFPLFEGAGGATEALAGGWRVNAVVTLQSGAPFTVNLGQDRANIGSGPAQRPDQIGDPTLPAGQRSADQWFNTAAFALQAPFTFGSAGRNSVFAPVWRTSISRS